MSEVGSRATKGSTPSLKVSMSSKREAPTVFTVGYEGRDVCDLVTLLRSHHVELLVDVRMTPISRKRGFSKTSLSTALEDAGIAYLHDRRLGNPKENRPAYRAGEQVAQRRYLKHVARDGGEALAHLSAMVSRSITALLCVEREASTCHRSALAEHLGAQIISL